MFSLLTWIQENVTPHCKLFNSYTSCIWIDKIVYSKYIGTDSLKETDGQNAHTNNTTIIIIDMNT